MIIGIFGPLGSGKTLLMTALLYHDYEKGRKVLTNYKTKFSQMLKAKHLAPTSDLNDVSIGIDEIHIFMDSRRSMEKTHLTWTHFITQARKRNVDLYYTTQVDSFVDVRFYMLSDVKIYAEGYDEELDRIIYTAYSSVAWLPRKFRAVITNASKYFDMYDTNELVTFDSILDGRMSLKRWMQEVKT